MSEVDNPAAFPSLDDNSYGLCLQYRGMTLRDYFAAKAMQSIIVIKGSQGFKYMDLTLAAYDYADAMLKARIMTEQERAREIIEEGKVAYSDGLSISESPYLDPSEEHDWWLKGYRREKELRRNSAKSAFEAAGKNNLV